MPDDWVLPPGTIRRTCNSCPRDFASRDGALTCAYCVDAKAQVMARKRKAGSMSASVSPFDPVVGGAGSAPVRRAGGFLSNLGKAR